MTTAAIEFEKVNVLRGKRRILAIDGLSIAPSEVLAVLGPNGAGKSTFLKCCVGMIGLSSGSVRVLGRSVGDLSMVGLTRLRRRVAYLAQILAHGSEMPLTVREVVAIGRTGRIGLCRFFGNSDWQMVDQWIERLGLKNLARRPYNVLSGGEQRKTLLAMAMVQQPDILLLDEPTANLDAYWREQMVAVLENLHARENLTIVLVCHNLETIPKNTDRVLILREGQILAHGRPEEVLHQDRIESLYGQGLAVLRHHGRFLLAPQIQEECH
ncbi:MAG: metal ABC transporter ATP-binding protein [Pirellulales bacterium]|nr:metal ABC transporter ATP-binding protein [Pirellulales bacterium]